MVWTIWFFAQKRCTSRLPLLGQTYMHSLPQRKNVAPVLALIWWWSFFLTTTVVLSKVKRLNSLKVHFALCSQHEYTTRFNGAHLSNIIGIKSQLCISYSDNLSWSTAAVLVCVYAVLEGTKAIGQQEQFEERT